MSRDERHVGLETAETSVHASAHRRADLEEQLQAALAAGDRQTVSEVRQRLAALEAGS